MRSRSSLLVRLLPAWDGVIVACLFAWLMRDVPLLGSLTAGVAALLVVPLWVELFRYFGLYASHRVETFGSLLRRIVTAHVMGAIIVPLAFLVLRCSSQARLSIQLALLSAVLVTVERSCLYFALRQLRKKGFDVRHVCVVGNWQAARRTAEMFTDHADWGMRVACVGVGPVETREFTSYPSGQRFGYRNLEEVLNREVIDEVLIAVSPEEMAREAASMQICEKYGLLARVLLDTGSPTRQSPTIEPYYGELSIAAGTAERNLFALVAKRILDVAIASIALVALAPVLAVCAALVKISSPGPVFFRQVRVGLHGRRFTILKFRTMIDGAESLMDAVVYRNSTKGPTFKDPGDVRVTEIGRVLRRFSLDELPQLFMVLKGEMSLVGPRPLPVDQSTAIRGEQRRRFSVKPGLTCLWQVNGRSDVEFTQWMQYDLQYVDGWSLWLDAKLLLKTIPVVLSGKGAY